mmetsp:Transcript_33171/g.50833  ORF Transcript_33171/g.50833 Transcript_33171/m.50833 type:complete len:85 (-) Transcript_33171:535-789(-)
MTSKLADDNLYEPLSSDPTKYFDLDPLAATESQQTINLIPQSTLDGFQIMENLRHEAVENPANQWTEKVTLKEETTPGMAGSIY